MSSKKNNFRGFPLSASSAEHIDVGINIIASWFTTSAAKRTNNGAEHRILSILVTSGVTVGRRGADAELKPPVLKSLHWLKIEQRIQYKLISLTYKVLTTSQPTYLHNLISLQTDNNTRSSDVVTLARPSPTSSLKVTDRSFQYASPHLWNQLPFSLREPVSPLYAYLNPSFCSPLSPSITPSLFHSKLKTYLFGKSFPPIDLLP